jgi:FKBP-type peptidyl-prolyl cis-trans isomerase
LFPIAFDLGLVRMYEGERYRFYFPSYLSYGQFSYGSELPSNSILEIEIEVDKIYTVEEEKQRQYLLMDEWIEVNLPEAEPTVTVSGVRIIETAVGNGIKVEFNESVSITYKGKFRNGTVFDENQFGFTFTVGAGTVIAGLDEGIRHLNKGGGKGILLIPSHLAYPRNPVIIPSRYNNTQITCFTDLIFEIEVL